MTLVNMIKDIVMIQKGLPKYMESAYCNSCNRQLNYIVQNNKIRIVDDSWNYKCTLREQR